MQIFKHSQFARQLILCLAIVLLVVFFFISAAFITSVDQFINNSAYKQSEIFAGNVWISIKRTITEIEQIPSKLTNIHKLTNSTLSPYEVLKSHPKLIGASIHYKTTDLDTSRLLHIIATRHSDDNITTTTKNYSSSHESICQKLDEQENKKGIWIYSEVNQKQTIAFCHPLQSSQHQDERYLKLDITLESITDLNCDYKLCPNNHIFILDSLGNYLGNYLTHSLNTIPASDSISQYLKTKIAKGETGCCIYNGKELSYFVYYSPIPFMQWRIGIVSPDKMTSHSSIKLYSTNLIYLAGAFLFIFVCILYVVHLQSLPLKKLTSCIRNIVDEQFNVDIPYIKSTREITELYSSFRYMQYRIVDHIDKLKISTAEQERALTEMLTAQRIQQSFLPKPIKLPLNLELAAELQQSRKVGGDLFQFFISDNRLYFAIGDVAGKGVAAAIYMSSVAKLFPYIAKQYQSTASICNIINEQMCIDHEADMYITMFIGILEIDTGHITYTNAGHTYPLIVLENGMIDSLLQYPDAPIGVLEGHAFTEHTYTLGNDCSMLLYTDGLTDAENCAGRFYGTEKLVQCVESVTSEPPKQIIQTVIKDIEKHIDTRQQSDDLTLLMLRYHKS